MGCTRKLAAQYGGIAQDTFNRWIRRGLREEDGKFRDFVNAINEAETKACLGALATILECAEDGNWKAAAWLLDRRYPDSYSRKASLALSKGDAGGGVKVAMEQLFELAQETLSDEEQGQLESILSKLEPPETDG
jgi:succinate dehydrogenase flavin-adding protein (antitoxin of CptAB toxin-antitoxin module)